MFPRDEKLMGRYLAAANGDVDLVYLAIEQAYRKRRFSPSPALILNQIRALKAKTRSANTAQPNNNSEHAAIA